MSSLFGNQALKRSLGVHSLAGIGSLRSRATAAVSPMQPRAKGTASSVSDFRPVAPDGRTLEELLYEARAQAKIHTSKVAMHMDDRWRKSLYRQLDSLLDVEEWLEGEAPLGTSSFATFLRLMLLVRPEIRPGLGLTSCGNLIASWQADHARLSVECMYDDAIRYVLSHEVDDRTEATAGDSTVDRVLEVLAPFNPQQWFARASVEPA